LVGWQEKKVLSNVPDSSFFETPDDETQRSWRNSAFQEFSRELGPRVSKRKTQDLLGSFLDQQEGSREALEGVFSSFPGSAKEKAFNLLDKYKQGFAQSTQATTLTPEEIAAKSNIFTMPEVGTEHLSETANKFLTDWLGMKNIENNTMQFAPSDKEESETFLGTSSYTSPHRTGGRLVEAHKETPDKPGPFFNELTKAGVTSEEKNTIDRYLNYDETLRSSQGNFKQSASNLIDSAIQKVTNSDSWSSFNEKDLPLFRGITGTNLETPQIGSTFTTERPTSWTPAFEVGKAFATGASKRKQDDTDLKSPKQRLYAVTEYSDTARDKLLAPGFESEVIAPSKSKFEVTGIGKLQEDINIPGADDIELVKLRQLYALDPVTAGLQGAGEMLRAAPKGLAGGAALSALSPDVAQSVAQGKYKQAATQTAQSLAGGVATDLGIQAAGQGLQRVAPQLAARFNPAVGAVADVAVPAAVGAGLFMQGRQGSPLNTIVNAASNTPFGLKVNPKTDAGRMAGHAIGNEAQYAWNQIMKGKLPWMGR
jgi:hypothetical protein